MHYIQLNNSTVQAIVDDNWQHLVQQSWLLTKDGYVATYKDYRQVYMHHIIIGYPPNGLVTDHKNRIKHDNQGHNLHHVTHAQNMCNKAPCGSSRFLGVFWDKTKRKWRARFKHRRGTYHLGYFTDEIEAARYYDRAAKRSLGVNAVLNFPNVIGN